MSSGPSINPSADTAASVRTLYLHTRTLEDSTVVRCTGHLIIDTSPHLKKEVKALLVNKRRVVLDLTELAYMDSAGLGALVALYISAKGASCQLQLVNLSPRIRALLSLTNVLSVFETYGRCGTHLP